MSSAVPKVATPKLSYKAPAMTHMKFPTPPKISTKVPKATPFKMPKAAMPKVVKMPTMQRMSMQGSVPKNKMATKFNQIMKQKLH